MSYIHILNQHIELLKINKYIVVKCLFVYSKNAISTLVYYLGRSNRVILRYFLIELKHFLSNLWSLNSFVYNMVLN